MGVRIFLAGFHFFGQLGAKKISAIIPAQKAAG
jgi:hypothetical protein